ncbi:MAG: hypothetical protein J5933_07665, partial [Clostridia bacterium]|nr:hypothetical protein [Clostridia bacterium]
MKRTLVILILLSMLLISVLSSCSGESTGSYYYAETATVAGYVLDSALYPVSVTEGGQCVTLTVTNSRARGNVQVQKTDETGAP